MIIVRNRDYTAFEQDIRELLSAFFPGETFSSEESGEAFLSLSVDGLMKREEMTGDRFEDKTLVKRKLYGVLSEKTGRKLPWGTLTGIKPVKLADKVLNAAGDDIQAADRILADRYLISASKRKLMLEIAQRERKLLESLPASGGYSFYFGIPFCPTRCLYCSFTSNPVEKFSGRVEEYLADMTHELRDFAETVHGGLPAASPSTVYIGGGTPTALTAAQLDSLLSSLKKYADFTALPEFTVEAGRPDSITEEKLSVLRSHGVSRISVNPQTMNQKTLDLIGRRHTVQQTLDAFALARRCGFDNINMDVIMGLPGETEKDVRHTLSVIEDLHPESLTVHALAVKRAARLSTEHDPWAEYERAEGEAVSVMTQLGAESAARMGMKPYYLYRQKNIAGNQENTGYAVPGTESLYNIIMMEEKQPVIGFGAGSTTKLSSTVRMENIRDLNQYLGRIGELLEKRRIFLQENRELLENPQQRACTAKVYGERNSYF